MGGPGLSSGESPFFFDVSSLSFRRRATYVRLLAFPTLIRAEGWFDPTVGEHTRVPMSCPHCGNRSPRHLDGASEGAFVDYYRCDSCLCVWNVQKGDPNGPVQIVNFESIKSTGTGDARRADPSRRRA